jgi:hypothetical protein
MNNGVSMALDQMKFENLALIVGFGMIVIILLFMRGITLKWGDKEVVIGGLKKLLAKKDEDIRLKDKLKRFSDEVDADVTSQLYDLVDTMDVRLEKLAMSEHCPFSFDQFVEITQGELKKRISRNNLKERMAEESRENYIERIVHNIRERYAMFQYKAASVKCGDKYADFSIIEEAVKKEITGFVNDTIDILVAAMKKKIAKYEEVKPLFKTTEA